MDIVGSSNHVFINFLMNCEIQELSFMHSAIAKLFPNTMKVHQIVKGSCFPHNKMKVHQIVKGPCFPHNTMKVHQIVKGSCFPHNLAFSPNKSMSPHSLNIKLKLLPSLYKKKRYNHMNNICTWFLPLQSTQPKR